MKQDWSGREVGVDLVQDRHYILEDQKALRVRVNIKDWFDHFFTFISFGVGVLYPVLYFFYIFLRVLTTTYTHGMDLSPFYFCCLLRIPETGILDE